MNYPDEDMPIDDDSQGIDFQDVPNENEEVVENA